MALLALSACAHSRQSDVYLRADAAESAKALSVGREENGRNIQCRRREIQFL